MLAFYAVRGYTPDALANLSAGEKLFLHCAREEYYKEQGALYSRMFGGG